MINVVETIAELRTLRASLKGKIGLVPTMGALHKGHRSLIEQACAENDHVIVTIFVNPTQFAPTEDLAIYPRDLEGDLKILEAAGVDAVFTPISQLMYPADYQTYIEVEHISTGLEGAQRPGHFRGVATIVAKLFNLTQPHTAYFGQKDAQQVAVIRRMAYDLNFPLEIAVCPTIREPDGLAMSSRNVYLTAEQRRAAPIVYQALQAAAYAYERGERDPKRLRVTMQTTLSAEPLASPDYLSIAAAQNLRELNSITDQPILVSLAVRIGHTRLLDNCLLPFSLNTREGLSQTLGSPTHTPPLYSY